MSHVLASRKERPWWRDAVTYQIYIRSFADANGDGIGDVEGIRSRLPYLKELGVDAIWITPWYPSPQNDHGYDVSDYMDIEPQYGTLADAEKLIKETHDHGIKFIVDIVPNHTSDQHKWFQAALKAAPGSPERDRFMFRDGKGPNGDLPPNNWEAVFGGCAWERVIEADGKPGQWYLHLFAIEQPDLNWENPEVRSHLEDVLKFWLDRGVDGFRIDVAHGMVKYPGLPDIPEVNTTSEMLAPHERPFWDQEGVHEIYRSWRKILDSYPGERMAVAEAWVSPAARIARYVRADELQNSFNFEMLTTLWNADEIRVKIDNSMAALVEVGAPPSWVFNNHDVVRSIDRLDLGLTNNGESTFTRQGDPAKFNIARGTLRAKSATLMTLALPGGTYLYQGEELGLPEVRDLPEDRLTDPRWKMSGYKDRGRDGCRVPLPWKSEPTGGFGFSTNDLLELDQAWLPMSPWMGNFSAESQAGIAGSTLTMYREALALRKLEEGLGDGPMTWIEAGKDVVAFSRPGNFACYINFGAAIEIPAGATVLISSGPLEVNSIPTDTAVWLRLA
ncbi:MAG: glycoside hydrolase family 13 protein [Actinobacteria bacterium]|nr:glycoside hydrolase family 13 protein [Actinomycetota bacterium]